MSVSGAGGAAFQGNFFKSSSASHSMHTKETINLADDQTILVFHLEGALLKSASLFPYFMLVAFESGGIIRALILLLLYPLVLLLGKEQRLKLLVFVCFAGIKTNFRIGSSILPKFFLEDIGSEGFDTVMSCRRRVAESELPRVMVEGFLKDYVGVEAVVGRELRTAHGYFLGLMEEKKEAHTVLENDQKMRIIGLGCLEHCQDIDQKQFFANCKEVYLVTEAEKRNWKILPRKKYPKSLIFHDGRLAFRPTPVATLYMFMWIPFGFLLYIIRILIFTSLPYKLSTPIVATTGSIITTSKPHNSSNSEQTPETGGLAGRLYVCNHRTLLDPIYISIALMKPVSAVVYSLSRYSEAISPIKTVRLSRDREKDRETMEKQLRQGDDLVVCPEGTTCREPYLLRFSPLFAELSDEIVPVAVDQHGTMFYGSTAGGIKCLDSLFQLMNPYPVYFVNFLNKLPSSDTVISGGKSSFEVANHVQHEIAKALGFQCTDLTRKDKYLILAGNEGTI